MIDTREEYGEVFGPYWAIGLGVFVVISLVIVAFAIRFRSRGEAYEHGPFAKKASKNTALEASWVVVLTATVALLVHLTFSSMSEVGADAPADIGGDARVGGGAPPAEVEIDVTSARWNWRFDYPEHGITVAGTGTRKPTLVVPVGNVRFDLTTVDVVHSFFIPHLRFKRDAFPGRVTRFTLGFPTAGDVPGRGSCAQYCGWRHLEMDFSVRVLPGDAFRRWAAAERRRQGRSA